jgi:hypothetical protein
VDGHPVLEPRAEENVHVRLRRSAHAAVLVDSKDTPCATGSAAEGLLHGVTQDAVAEWTVEPPEALGRGGVHGQDEPEVDGVRRPHASSRRALLIVRLILSTLRSSIAHLLTRAWDAFVGSRRALKRRPPRALTSRGARGGEGEALVRVATSALQGP